MTTGDRVASRWPAACSPLRARYGARESPADFHRRAPAERCAPISNWRTAHQGCRPDCGRTASPHRAGRPHRKGRLPGRCSGVGTPPRRPPTPAARPRPRVSVANRQPKRPPLPPKCPDRARPPPSAAAGRHGRKPMLSQTMDDGVGDGKSAVRHEGGGPQRRLGLEQSSALQIVERRRSAPTRNADPWHGAVHLNHHPTGMPQRTESMTSGPPTFLPAPGGDQRRDRFCSPHARLAADCFKDLGESSAAP